MARKKKLRKIPYDLVSYIQIETECIRDANDKMMIASYCLGKLQTVNWYIQLLETGNEKYSIPHTLPELETIRDQLQACYQQIMAARLKLPGERPYLDIKYPPGFEG